MDKFVGLIKSLGLYRMSFICLWIILIYLQYVEYYITAKFFIRLLNVYDYVAYIMNYDYAI